MGRIKELASQAPRTGMKVVRIDEIPRHLRTQQQRSIILIGPAVKLVIGVVLIIDPDP